MREKILNILGVLSESLLEDKDLFYDSQEIWEKLGHQGFSDQEIESALAHIERIFLGQPGKFWSDRIPTYRSFSTEENCKLTAEARGYLWSLKSRGVIDHALEDEIVSKAMDLEESVGRDEIKTVAALTIFGYEHKFQKRNRKENKLGSLVH